MKRVFFSILPMILLSTSIVFIFYIETVFMNGIIDIFNLDGAYSLNVFNTIIVIVLGLLMIYILSKYIMEINERIFRTFTFVLNFIGIITIITVVITSGFLEWK